MTEERITSRKNPFVRHLVRLGGDRDYRRETGEYLAEGTKLYLDALEAGVEITAVASLPEGAPPLPEEARFVTLPPDVFSAASTQKTPQGLLFTARLPDSRPPVRLPAASAILLDGVQDPGNVGTVVRTAAAFGVRTVLLTGDSADPFSPKTVRASMGGLFRTAVIVASRAELLALLARSSMRLLAAEPDGGASVDIRSASLENACVAVGSEGRGVSEEIRLAAEGALRIPMAAGSESLNAAMSAGILLWEMAKQSGFLEETICRN
ncbi:RNA methyltransferase [Oscillospiraceae bacterium OttesenSCG-928-G22]|nr:RNA methyltransferase [Oscillospiraceae bacterium OttesenSCG-928-G22]